MENILCTFPHIFQQILDELDLKSLADCRLVAKSWLSFVDNSKSNWIRMIRQLINLGSVMDLRENPYKKNFFHENHKEDPDEGM